MSKLYLILAVLATINFVQSHVHKVQTRDTEEKVLDLTHMNATELENEEIKILEVCRAKENEDKSAVTQFLEQDGGVPDSPKFKLVLDCWAKKMGYLKDGKVNWDQIKLATDVYHKHDAEELKKAMQIYEDCKKIPLDNLDSKEISYVITKCNKEGYVKHKLEW